MATKVSPIPAGHHTLTPHLIVKGGEAAIAFYKKAFGAEDIGCVMKCPQTGKVLHAEIKIGDSMVYLAEEVPDWGILAPGESSPVTLHLYVEDVDKSFERAAAAGATVVMPPMDQFWGDRYAKLKDPFGHSWSLASHIEDVPPEELNARMVKCMEEAAAAAAKTCEPATV